MTCARSSRVYCTELWHSGPSRAGVAAWFAEVVEYGGMRMTRADMIVDLESKGASPRMVDRYLQGHALAEANQRHAHGV